MRSMLRGLIQKDIPKRNLHSLPYKTGSALKLMLLFFTLSPKETGWAYEEGQDYPIWKENKHGREFWTQCVVLDGSWSEVKAHLKYL